MRGGWPCAVRPMIDGYNTAGAHDDPLALAWPRTLMRCRYLIEDPEDVLGILPGRPLPYCARAFVRTARSDPQRHALPPTVRVDDDELLRHGIGVPCHLLAQALKVHGVRLRLIGFPIALVDGADRSEVWRRNLRRRPIFADLDEVIGRRAPSPSPLTHQTAPSNRARPVAIRGRHQRSGQVQRVDDPNARRGSARRRA
jgi:hypothetical protein